MKTLLTICCLAIAFFAKSQTTVTLTKPAYSIKYLDTWRVDNSDNTTFLIGAPSDGEGDAFVENLHFTSYPVSGYLPKGYAQYSKTTLPTKIKNFKVVAENQVKQGGKTGYYMVFTGKQNGQSLKWKQYYFIEKSKCYVLTFTCEATKFDAYLKSCAPMLNSFTVK
jgi:hypothetical protein